MKARDVTKSLATMSPEELRDLQGRLTFLLGGKTALDVPEDVPDRDLALVFDTSKAVLRQFGCLRVPPMSVLAKTGKLGPLKKGAPAVLDYAETFLKPKGRNERAKAVHFLLEIAARRLRERNLPVTPKTLFESLPNIHASVDRCFPGYQASGLLAMVFRRQRTG